MRRVRPVGVLLVVGLSLSVFGCGGGKGKVAGSVTLNGQPLPDARLEFRDKSNPALTLADIRADAQGKFELLSDPKARGPRLPPGTYIVLVSKLVDKDGKSPSEEDYGMKLAANELHNSLPDKYNDLNNPQFTVEVKEDTKTLPPFDVKGQ